MNSVQLANRAWNWAKECTIMPDDNIIYDKIKKLGVDWPLFVIVNAGRRVITRVKEFREAQSRGNESLIQRLCTVPIYEGPVYQKFKEA